MVLIPFMPFRSAFALMQTCLLDSVQEVDHESIRLKELCYVIAFLVNEIAL